MKNIKFTYIKLILTLTLLGLLGGCATTQPEKVIYKDKIVVVMPPPGLLEGCQFTESPPDQIEFITANYPEQVEILTQYSITLIGDVKKCMVVIKNLEKWNKAQSELSP